MDCPECGYNLSSSNVGKFKCPECLTVTISSINGGKRVVEDIKPPYSHSPLPARKVLCKTREAICIGCYQVIDTCFTAHGTLIKSDKGGFRKEVVETWWNPIKGTLEETISEKFIPISIKLKGWICSSCISYDNIIHTRKDGSKWYEPVCVIDPSSTYNQTINPGGGAPKERVAPLKDILHRSGLVIGKEVPLVDPSCYAKFGSSTRGGRRNHA